MGTGKAVSPAKPEGELNNRFGVGNQECVAEGEDLLNTLPAPSMKKPEDIHPSLDPRKVMLRRRPGAARLGQRHDRNADQSHQRQVHVPA